MRSPITVASARLGRPAFTFLQFPSKGFNFFPEGLPKVSIPFQKLQKISANRDFSMGYGRLEREKICDRAVRPSAASRRPAQSRRPPSVLSLARSVRDFAQQPYRRHAKRRAPAATRPWRSIQRGQSPPSLFFHFLPKASISFRRGFKMLPFFSKSCKKFPRNGTFQWVTGGRPRKNLRSRGSPERGLAPSGSIASSTVCPRPCRPRSPLPQPTRLIEMTIAWISVYQKIFVEKARI